MSCNESKDTLVKQVSCFVDDLFNWLII